MIEEHNFNILKEEYPPKYPLEFVQTIEMARIMIDKMGVDPSAVDKVSAVNPKGMNISPLLIAGGGVSGRLKWLQFILESGADPCHKNVSNMSSLPPYHY
jgi:hypothetical protein